MSRSVHHPIPKFSPARLSILALAAGLIFGGGLLAQTPVESARSLENWLPEDVIGFLKLKEPGASVRDLLKSDLWKQVQSSKLYQIARSKEEFRKFENQLEDFRQAAGKDFLDAADDLLGKEAIAGMRLSFPPEVLVITRSRSNAALKAGVEALKTYVQRKQGAFPETLKSDRQGITVENIDNKIVFAVHEDSFFISNTQRGVEDMIDLAKEKTAKSVRRSAVYGSLFESAASKPEALALAALRPRFVPNFRLPEKVDNPVASLLFSGWLEALRNSDLLHARLTAGAGRLKLQVSTVADSKEAIDKVASTFFPVTGAAAELEELSRIARQGMIGAIHLRRGFAQWWEKKEDFLVPGAVGELTTNFRNVMNVIFAGHSFEDEVLPELEPGFTLVTSRVKYEGLDAPPHPQIPAFAGIFRLKNAEKFNRSMTSAFQSLVSLVNLDRAQKQKGAALLLNQVKVGEVDIYSSNFDQPREKKNGPLGIEYNFSPSFAVVGSKVILSSHLELARKLVEALSSKTAPAAKEEPRGIDLAVVNAGELDGILNANRQILIDKSMLDEGISREEADLRYAALSEAIRLFNDARLETRSQDRTSTIQLELRLAGKPEKPAAGKKQEL